MSIHSEHYQLSIDNDMLNAIRVYHLKELDRLSRESAEMREALEANQVFHTPIALSRKPDRQWNEYEIDAINLTKSALSTSAGAGYVKREEVKEFIEIVGCLGRALKAGAIMINPNSLNERILKAAKLQA